MDRSDVPSWRGYFSALQTPFTADGTIDLDALGKTTHLFISQGVRGLLVNGSTGEWGTQSIDERTAGAEKVIEAAAGRVPVSVAVTHPDISLSTDLAQHAHAAGADSIMVPPPPGLRPTRLELTVYYEEIAAATPLPLWLYNFPQENGCDISLDHIGELAAIPTVVAIKQSNPDERVLYETIRRYGDQILVFGHMVSRLGAAVIASGFGGDGHYGSGMLLGKRMADFFDHVWSGDLKAAGEIADQFTALTARLRGPDNDGYNWRYAGMQSSLKAVMNLQGQPGGYPRRPRLPLTDPSALSDIADALREAGLDLKGA